MTIQSRWHRMGTGDRYSQIRGPILGGQSKMPVYEFKCEKCGWTWKHFFKRYPHNGMPCFPYPDKPECDGTGEVINHKGPKPKK